MLIDSLVKGFFWIHNLKTFWIDASACWL